MAYRGIAVSDATGVYTWPLPPIYRLPPISYIYKVTSAAGYRQIIFTKTARLPIAPARLILSLRKKVTMSWSKSTTTKHTCGGPVFGHKTPGCPRCDELLAGAAPVVWANATPHHCLTCGRKVKNYGVCFSCQLKAHDCKISKCGRFCTFGDW